MMAATYKRNIGSQCISWRVPVNQFGSGEESLKQKLAGNKFVGVFNIQKREGHRARLIVDGLLKLLKKSLTVEARHYRGLVVQRYIRQGSSRDGLKVIAPDEFDVLLQFSIAGLQLEATCLQKGYDTVAELGEINVKDVQKMDLERNYPELFEKGAFVQLTAGSTWSLSSRVLQENIFVSLIDKAARQVVDSMQSNPLEHGSKIERIERLVNPPSVCLKAYTDDQTLDIAIDIVPGLLVGVDAVPNKAEGGVMKCPRHYVFKWLKEEQVAAGLYENPENLWRVCTSGYEIYLLDFCRYSKQRKYIMTALRILKAYFSKARDVAKKEDTPQVVFTLRSYHLKHVAFYCIMYVTFQYSKLNGSSPKGVRESLGYLLDLLEVSLTEKRLPHFFHGNSALRQIFPDYIYDESFLCFNLYGRKSDEALKQAASSLDQLRMHLDDFVIQGPHNKQLVQDFTEYIRGCRFF